MLSAKRSERLDKYLASETDFSRSTIQKLISEEKY